MSLTVTELLSNLIREIYSGNPTETGDLWHLLMGYLSFLKKSNAPIPNEIFVKVHICAVKECIEIDKILAKTTDVYSIEVLMRIRSQKWDYVVLSNSEIDISAEIKEPDPAPVMEIKAPKLRAPAPPVNPPPEKPLKNGDKVVGYPPGFAAELNNKLSKRREKMGE